MTEVIGDGNVQIGTFCIFFCTVCTYIPVWSRFLRNISSSEK